MLKIAHRGASGLEPENTLPAFRKAIQLGTDMIELDVRQCGSGELVVTHNATLLRTFGAPGRVKDKKLSELKKLSEKTGKRILTLEEVLKEIQGRTGLDIELKERETAHEALAIIRKSLKNGWSWNNFLISSFHHQELAAARRNSTQVQIGILYAAWPLGYQSFAKKIRAKAIIIHHLFLNKSLIKEAQKQGLQAYAWTVNSPKEIAKFKNWGIDGIISNYPERL